jgi:hypothetical protein
MAPVQVIIDFERVTRLIGIVPAARFGQLATANPLPAVSPAQTGSFGTASLKGRLVVGEAQVSIPDLAALRPGDVIVLESHVTSPLLVHLSDGCPSLRALLGRSGPMRAVQVVAP